MNLIVLIDLKIQLKSFDILIKFGRFKLQVNSETIIILVFVNFKC